MRITPTASDHQHVADTTELQCRDCGSRRLVAAYVEMKPAGISGDGLVQERVIQACCADCRSLRIGMAQPAQPDPAA